MASAFSMLFFTLFSDGGPINSLLMQIGFISEPYKFYHMQEVPEADRHDELPDVVW